MYKSSAFGRVLSALREAWAAWRSDWSRRDVLVGTLSRPEQLEVCLHHRFYHIPAWEMTAGETPVQYVALYQSKTLFGQASGVRYYGRVTACQRLQRHHIREIPSESTVPYYRFEIESWQELPRAIRVREMGFVKHFTTLFLLQHSREMPELWMQSYGELRLYRRLRTLIRRGEGRLRVRGGTVRIENGVMTVFRGTAPVHRYDLQEYVKNPYTVFCRIRRDMKS